MIAIGIRLAVAEPRITAANLLTGSFVPAIVVEEARQAAPDLFDAFGSKEKALHANLGGHAGVPQFEADDGGRFFARHLK